MNYRGLAVWLTPTAAIGAAVEVENPACNLPGIQKNCWMSARFPAILKPSPAVL